MYRKQWNVLVTYFWIQQHNNNNIIIIVVVVVVVVVVGDFQPISSLTSNYPQTEMKEHPTNWFTEMNNNNNSNNNNNNNNN